MRKRFLRPKLETARYHYKYYVELIKQGAYHNFLLFAALQQWRKKHAKSDKSGAYGRNYRE